MHIVTPPHDLPCVIRVTPQHEDEAAPEPVTWLHSPTRRQVACVSALRYMWEVSGGALYLWTFTLPWIMRDENAAARMTRFWQTWQRKLGRCSAVRVAEAHKSGMLHFHAVINRRYPAREVWRMAAKCGMGHLDVVAIRDWPGALYVAKYLGKDSEPFTGIQRYVRSGMSVGKLRDQWCESDEAELMRAVIGAEKSAQGTTKPGAWMKAKRVLDAYRQAS